MVEHVEEKVGVDKQGRLVLPANLRETLGIKDGGQVSIRLDGTRLVLEPIPEDLEEAVREWAQQPRGRADESPAEEAPESWKWMSREYARKKLGLS
jgi:AbrB family looped-hinge helix DNA binding protein